MKKSNLTARYPKEAILMMDLPALEPEIIEGFKNLSDLAGTISDAMDELGIVGAVPASVLRPTIPTGSPGWTGAYRS